jgi:hypothetical protein
MLTRNSRRRKRKLPPSSSPPVGTSLTFRAEVMPGKDRNERTFQVTRVLANARIELARLEGQHSLAEFESVPKAQTEPGPKDPNELK